MSEQEKDPTKKKLKKLHQNILADMKKLVPKFSLVFSFEQEFFKEAYRLAKSDLAENDILEIAEKFIVMKLNIPNYDRKHLAEKRFQKIIDIVISRYRNRKDAREKREKVDRTISIEDTDLSNRKDEEGCDYSTYG